MTLSRRTTFVASACVLSALACSSPAAAPQGIIDDPFIDAARPDESPDAQSPDAAPPDAVDEADAVSLVDATTSPDLGELLIEDIADTDCATPGGKAVFVTRSPDVGIGFQRVGAVGDRRFAFGPVGSALMTFAVDGTDPSYPVLGPVGAAAQTNAIAALFSDVSSVDVRFYDSLAQPIADDVHLGDGANDALSVSAAPDTSFVAWRSSGVVVGRVIAQQGATVTPFTLDAGSGGEGRCQTASTWNGTGYTLVWTRTQHDGKTKTSWVRVGLDGQWGFAQVVSLSDGVHTIVDIAKTSAGYALLLEEGSPFKDAVLVRLDEFGHVIAPSYRLLGTREAWGLAAVDSGVGVIASRDDGRTVFRSFDSASGAPLGPWVCVDEDAPDVMLAPQGAVSAEGAGYGILARMPDGSINYRRTDNLGTGP